MTDTERRERFKKIMVVLTSAFPNYAMQAATMEVYYKSLSDIELEELEAAVYDCITKCEFFPTVRAIRDSHAHIQVQIRGELTAEEAWVFTCEQMREHGFYNAPNIQSDLIWQTIHALGGWRAMCQATNLEADRAHFMRIYDNLLKRQKEKITIAPVVKKLIEQHKAKLLGEKSNANLDEK